MQSTIERSNRLYTILCALKEGYRYGYFMEFYSFLADDCVYESQWGSTALHGKKAIQEHLTRKGNSIREEKNFSSCDLVEIMNPYPGKLGLIVEQNLDSEIHSILADLTLNNEGLVSRIDICISQLYNFREFRVDFNFIPEGNGVEDVDNILPISEFYTDELCTFFNVVEVDFDCDTCMHISMDKWIAMLNAWKTFCNAPSFDEAFEMLADADYYQGTVTNNKVRCCLAINGQKMWLRRKFNEHMLTALVEWTDIYRSKYTYMNSEEDY